MKKKMDIIYESKDLLVVNKPAKILAVGTEKEHVRTLYYEASSYVKKKHPKNKVFVVNRLDKDTSGVMVFAKNEALKKKLQDSWNDFASTREYLVVVEGKVLEKKGVLKSYLVEDKTLRVHSTKDSKLGRLAITSFEVIGVTRAYSLLVVRIRTGRKNQIRVQLSDMGHPIIGDKKYGSVKNPMGRLGLHASLLELNICGEKFVFKAKIPKEFKSMFEKEVIEYEKKING